MTKKTLTLKLEVEVGGLPSLTSFRILQLKIDSVDILNAVYLWHKIHFLKISRNYDNPIFWYVLLSFSFVLLKCYCHSN